MGAPKFSLWFWFMLLSILTTLLVGYQEYWSMHWTWLLWCRTHFLFDILTHAIFELTETDEAYKSALRLFTSSKTAFLR